MQYIEDNCDNWESEELHNQHFLQNTIGFVLTEIKIKNIHGSACTGTKLTRIPNGFITR